MEEEKNATSNINISEKVPSNKESQILKEENKEVEKHNSQNMQNLNIEDQIPQNHVPELVPPGSGATEDISQPTDSNRAGEVE